MSVISLDLPSNILYGEEQVLEFDKIATFIGGNGSGKSTILKSIFDEKLEGTKYEEHRIVCFSSGQNESYSEKFGEYLREERRQRKALNLDCFYYDKLWSMLLIFLATTSRHDGEVRKFLKQNQYIRESDLDEDETTELSFKVKVDQSYLNLVRQSVEDEEKGETDIITNKAYHRTLNNFINSLVKEDYEFNESIDLTTIKLNQDKLSSVSFETDEGASFDSKVMFFTQAADNDYFIVKDSFKLTFEKNGETLYLSDLSDGEYQLLFIYSLIDLFDSKNTLFLLDEADSHLHYKNIEKLWSIYNNVKGSIITTTHLLDSIAKAGSKRLKMVEVGKIESSNNPYKLLQRLESLTDITMIQYKVASMYKNVVLMDNSNDWEIFKLLLKRKFFEDEELIKKIEERLSEFVCIGVPSSYIGGISDSFADKKINWLLNFAELLNLEKVNQNTEKAFLICDRDELSFKEIGTRKCDFLVNGLNQKFPKPLSNTPILSWKRREVKHYLLSFSALSGDIEVINNDSIPRNCYLFQGSTGDYITGNKYNDYLATIESRIVKDVLTKYIDVEGFGFSIEKAQSYVDTIPKEEISEDIVKMYSYLVGENE